MGQLTATAHQFESQEYTRAGVRRNLNGSVAGSSGTPPGNHITCPQVTGDLPGSMPDFLLDFAVRFSHHFLAGSGSVILLTVTPWTIRRDLNPSAGVRARFLQRRVW